MFEHHLFTYIKTDTESREGMGHIIRGLEVHIDWAQWDEAADRGELISKVAAKITRIRQKLLQQGLLVRNPDKTFFVVSRPFVEYPQQQKLIPGFESTKSQHAYDQADLQQSGSPQSSIYPEGQEEPEEQNVVAQLHWNNLKSQPFNIQGT